MFICLAFQAHVEFADPNHRTKTNKAHQYFVFEKAFAIGRYIDSFFHHDSIFAVCANQQIM